MAFLHAFTVGDFVDTLISLLAAFVLGTLIGAERQYRRRGGGLRTHTLVAVGAATFVDIGMYLNGNAGATQIIAYVVSGVAPEGWEQPLQPDVILIGAGRVDARAAGTPR